MMTEWTWNEFCEFYYETAKNYARTHLERLRRKIGEFDRRVDLDYVTDAAVLSALEKAYSHFDSKKGVKITTYLSTIVHNEIVDGMERESKAAAIQQDIADVKSALRAFADDDTAEARARLVPRLMAAVAKLSPSDQVILNYYLEDKSSYIARSSSALNIPESYVSIRRHRILKLLPKLMEMTRADYLQFCYEYESGVLASLSVFGNEHLSLKASKALRANPVQPELDLENLVSRLLDFIAKSA